MHLILKAKVKLTCAGQSYTHKNKTAGLMCSTLIRVFKIIWVPTGQSRQQNVQFDSPRMAVFSAIKLHNTAFKQAILFCFWRWYLMFFSSWNSLSLCASFLDLNSNKQFWFYELPLALLPYCTTQLQTKHKAAPGTSTFYGDIIYITKMCTKFILLLLNSPQPPPHFFFFSQGSCFPPP